MKKSIAFLLILCIFITLAGCNNSKTGAKDSGTSNQPAANAGQGTEEDAANSVSDNANRDEVNIPFAFEANNEYVEVATMSVPADNLIAIYMYTYDGHDSSDIGKANTIQEWMTDAFPDIEIVPYGYVLRSEEASEIWLTAYPTGKDDNVSDHVFIEDDSDESNFVGGTGEANGYSYEFLSETIDSEFGEYRFKCTYQLNDDVEFRVELINGKEKGFDPDEKSKEIARMITVK